MKDFKRLFIMFICCVLLRSTCLAAEIGTANTDVYVRSIETGDVVGSLAKNDKVSVVGKTGGWAKVMIGDKQYKVWNEYLDVETTDDDTKTLNKVRKSKSMEKENKSKVKIKSKNKIKKGSKWDDIGAALEW